MPNKVLIDTGAVLMTGIDATETQAINEQQRWQKINMGSGIRAVEVTDINKQKYLLLVNFTKTPKNVKLRAVSSTCRLIRLTCPEKTVIANELALKPFTAYLLKTV
jgi:hypothetical protein